MSEKTLSQILAEKTTLEMEIISVLLPMIEKFQESTKVGVHSVDISLIDASGMFDPFPKFLVDNVQIQLKLEI